MTNTIVGIDLGTSNICLSYWDNNHINIIQVNSQNTFPALIYFNNNTCLIGYDALPYSNDINCFHSLKRFISSHNYKNLYIELLKYIKSICDSKLNNYDVIITVPSYFNDNHRNYTKECAQLAGLNCIRIINESTSACIAYGFGNNNDEKIIMVLDIGAGTTDISFVKIDSDIIEVISSYGDLELGGYDITNKLIEFLLSKFIQKHKITNIDNLDLNNNQLFHKVEKLKIKLSNEQYTEQVINNFYNNINLDLAMTRNDMINNCTIIWNKIETLIMTSMEKSKLTQDNIDYIILVGGTTKIPHIKTIIKKIFHYNKILDTIDPDTIVSSGASILGSIINNTNKKDLIILDISQFSYGIEGDNGEFITIIEKNMPLPSKISKKFTTTDDNTENINIKIYQGEDINCKNNYLIGTIDLNIEKEKKGIPVINISFHLDINNILTIYIEDKKSGNNKQIVINR